MQNASRGWFEDEAVFDEMCRREENEAKKKYNAKLSGGKSKNVNKKTSAPSRAGGSSGWATVSSQKQSAGSRNSAVKAEAKKSGFAAAFGPDTDSDED